MVLLAIASLAAIPAMVSASGATAWGAIALGQSIGSIAAVIIAYGWGLSGPAIIARADESGRASHYLESVVTKLVLCLPVSGAAFLVALLIAGDLMLFAGLGALSTAAVGLTSNWYFVGRSSPYLLLVFETLPRVLGTGIGIALMVNGSSALVGVVWQLIGMMAAFCASVLWIVRPWRLRETRAVTRRPVPIVLNSQRHGITSTVLGSFYSSAPIIIVALVAPAAQPVYAVVEKVQRQIVVGLGPFVTAMQGWVPRGSGSDLNRRIKQGTVAATVGCFALAGGMLAFAPALVRWLGDGQIEPTFITLVLMAVITAISLFESFVSKACLSALGRLDLVSAATAIGTVVGLPLVAAGAVTWGAGGALSGIATGLLLRLVIEAVGMLKTLARPAGKVTAAPFDPMTGADSL